MSNAARLPNYSCQLQQVHALPYELCVHKGYVPEYFLCVPVPNVE